MKIHSSCRFGRRALGGEVGEVERRQILVEASNGVGEQVVAEGDGLDALVEGARREERDAVEAPGGGAKRLRAGLVPRGFRHAGETAAFGRRLALARDEGVEREGQPVEVVEARAVAGVDGARRLDAAADAFQSFRDNGRKVGARVLPFEDGEVFLRLAVPLAKDGGERAVARAAVEVRLDRSVERKPADEFLVLADGDGLRGDRFGKPLADADWLRQREVRRIVSDADRCRDDVVIERPVEESADAGSQGEGGLAHHDDGPGREGRKADGAGNGHRRFAGLQRNRRDRPHRQVEGHGEPRDGTRAGGTGAKKEKEEGKAADVHGVETSCSPPSIRRPASGRNIKSGPQTFHFSAPWERSRRGPRVPSRSWVGEKPDRRLTNREKLNSVEKFRR